jgi:hypothetical protein
MRMMEPSPEAVTTFGRRDLPRWPHECDAVNRPPGCRPLRRKGPTRREWVAQWRNWEPRVRQGDCGWVPAAIAGLRFEDSDGWPIASGLRQITVDHPARKRRVPRVGYTTRHKMRLTGWLVLGFWLVLAASAQQIPQPAAPVSVEAPYAALAAQLMRAADDTARDALLASQPGYLLVRLGAV